jgi:hypothetical protein
MLLELSSVCKLQYFQTVSSHRAQNEGDLAVGHSSQFQVRHSSIDEMDVETIFQGNQKQISSHFGEVLEEALSLQQTAGIISCDIT